MSYQVNFKLFVPECEYWETEIITNMQRELHEAAMLVFERNGLHNKQVGLSSAEVSFLMK